MRTIAYHSLLLLLSLSYCVGVMGQYNLSVEVYAEDVVPGQTTYRFYLNMVNDDDFLSSVFGNEYAPFAFETTTGFYNSQFGGTVASTINPAFLPFFPDLGADSWVTIGIESQNVGNEVPISTSESSNQPWVAAFAFGQALSGQNVYMNDSEGGAWHVMNGTPNGLPDEDGRVLIMQATTAGEISGTINVEVFVHGNAGSANSLTHSFSGIGEFVEGLCLNGLPPEEGFDCFGNCILGDTNEDGLCDCNGLPPNEGYDCLGSCLMDTDGDGVCDEFEIPGCTNPGACNYLQTATDNDGSCEFTSCAGCDDSAACNYEPTALLAGFCDYSCLNSKPFELRGVFFLSITPTPTTMGIGLHFNARDSILDLSHYGVGVASNGWGSDGQEYTFPPISLLPGDDILLARNPEAVQSYFSTCFDEFEHVLTAPNVINHNGNDAIEVFSHGTKIQIFGDPDVNGTGEEWEYTGAWAYLTDCGWTYPELNCTSGSTTFFESSCLYPICGVMGCTDANACNYDASANIETGQCQFPLEGYDCNGECLSDQNQNGICDHLELEALQTELEDGVYCGEGTIWSGELGECIAYNPCPKDLDGDGAIGVEDLLQLLNAFGTDCPDTEGSTTSE